MWIIAHVLVLAALALAIVALVEMARALLAWVSTSPGRLLAPVERAAELAPTGGAGADVLARGGHSLEAWRASLHRLARRGEHGYRSRHVDLADVARVLEDPTAPAELRIGAAIALTTSDDVDEARRMQSAIMCCTDHALREALAEAAYGDLDERTFARARLLR